LNRGCRQRASLDSFQRPLEQRLAKLDQLRAGRRVHLGSHCRGCILAGARPGNAALRLDDPCHSTWFGGPRAPADLLGVPDQHRLDSLDCAEVASLSRGVHRVSVDEVVAAMRQSSKDLQSAYRETSAGGLAAFHR